jgi:LmbE family N-acetylglucosaminyl deacetylase
MNKIALAIVAHPDDIEFRIAGTLILLKQAGWETHYLNIATGSLGSVQFTAPQARKVRRSEAQAAAKVMGAHWHPSLVDDIEIFYNLKTLKRLTAVIRAIKPSVLLTHPPVDYMEDHTNACRLAVSAAFARGMPNLKTQPAQATFDGDITVYHCLPHGMSDPLGRPVIPQCFINIASVLAQKADALNSHRSQAHWLETSQGCNALSRFMETDALKVGRMSRKFKYAEGFWRHLHLGFCAPEADPLRTELAKYYLENPKWKRMLKECE